jgi:hypothetical protein
LSEAKSHGCLLGVVVVVGESVGDCWNGHESETLLRGKARLRVETISRAPDVEPTTTATTATSSTLRTPATVGGTFDCIRHLQLRLRVR